MAARTQHFASKPRVFILSDISNEPDDAESLVRYLLYSNQFTTEGLVAVTSTWMKNKVCPEDMHRILDAYALVVGNLNAHAHPDAQYPTAEHLKSLVRSGPPVYGSAAVGDSIPLSEGGELLLSRILHPSPSSPLWILVWGGTNVLAQVLLKLRSTRPAAELSRLLANLRVYTISDQDDTSTWIRHQFPELFYISSLHGWNQYGLAAWTGISGDKYYGFDKGGPDFSKMTMEWIKENIQIGDYGKAYPDYLFIPEGDTPTFLYLIQNGLGVAEQPSYGSWGGRYLRTNIGPDGGGHHSDAADAVIGADGREHRSNQATIWRWRDAYQNDFAARMRWTLSPEFGKANHHPVVCVNGTWGTEPLSLTAEAGTAVELDASESYDPDEGDELTFRWWHYREPSATQWSTHLEVAEVGIETLDEGCRKARVQLPGPERCCLDLMSRKPVEMGQIMHVILEVRDSGTPALTSYRRVLIQTTNKELQGGGGMEGMDAVAEAMAGVLEK